MATGGYQSMGSPGASFNPQQTPTNTQGGLQNALMQKFAPGAGTFARLPQTQPMQMPNPVSQNPMAPPQAAFHQQPTMMPAPQQQGMGQPASLGLGQGMNNPFARPLVR